MVSANIVVIASFSGFKTDFCTSRINVVLGLMHMQNVCNSIPCNCMASIQQSHYAQN